MSAWPEELKYQLFSNKLTTAAARSQNKIKIVDVASRRAAASAFSGRGRREKNVFSFQYYHATIVLLRKKNLPWIQY
jgi:hypothetical protein